MTCIEVYDSDDEEMPVAVVRARRVLTGGLSDTVWDDADLRSIIPILLGAGLQVGADCLTAHTIPQD